MTNSITQLAGLNLGGGADGAVDLLLVGTDSRTDAKGVPLTSKELRWLRAGDETATNTDTILLIRIPNNGSSATAISIPRDDVDVPGIGKSKINAAWRNQEKVRRTAVERGGNPDKGAERDGTKPPQGTDRQRRPTDRRRGRPLRRGRSPRVRALLTNAVGGVDVCLKNPVRDVYSGAKFRRGRQTLNGPKALSFVRQRHGLPAATSTASPANRCSWPLSRPRCCRQRSSPTRRRWASCRRRCRGRSSSTTTGTSCPSPRSCATFPAAGPLRNDPDRHRGGWSEEGQSIVKVDPKAVHEFTGRLLNGDDAKRAAARRPTPSMSSTRAPSTDSPPTCRTS